MVQIPSSARPSTGATHQPCGVAGRNATDTRFRSSGPAAMRDASATAAIANGSSRRLTCHAVEMRSRSSSRVSIATATATGSRCDRHATVPASPMTTRPAMVSGIQMGRRTAGTDFATSTQMINAASANSVPITSVSRKRASRQRRPAIRISRSISFMARSGEVPDLRETRIGRRQGRARSEDSSPEQDQGRFPIGSEPFIPCT